MINVEFSEQDLKIIDNERYNHPVPRVQRRMEVLWLKSQGLPHKQIAKLAGVCDSSVTNYLRLYQKGGLDEVRKVSFYRPKSELEKHFDSIEEYFREHPVATIKEAVAKIEELTGIHRSETQVRKFLKNLGLKRRKVGSVPAKADVEIQEQFKEEQMEPRLEEAKAGKRRVFFMDAAHFVFAPFLGLLWCFVRVFIKAPAGRKRYNVSSCADGIGLPP